MPNTWPIPRKGSKYLAKLSHANKDGISLLFILREILGFARTRKEAKQIVFSGKVKVNNKIRKNENFPVQVFDVISLEKGKNYRLGIVNRKFGLQEIPETEVWKKIVKISGKKLLKNKKIQMNLEDGQNLLVSEKFSVGDSVMLDTIQNKIKKILPLKEGANVEIVAGKHAGEKGRIKSIAKLERQKIYSIKLKKGEVALPFKTILVIE